jgi:hypothetical protein
MIDVTRELAAAKAAPALDELAASSAAPVLDLEVVRMRTLLPQLVSRCMAYAAQPAFDDALVAGVEAFYGLDVDVATAETQVLEDPIERVRFFPWLLWDRALVADPEDGDADGDADGAHETIGTRFAREGELDGREVRLLGALNAACVWFWQVAATTPRAALTELIELGTGRRVTVWDKALPSEIAIGEVLQARLVEVSETGLALLDAVHLTLPGEVLRELTAAAAPFVSPDGRLDVARVRDATPDLFDLATRLAEGSAELTPPHELLTTLRVPPDGAAALEPLMAARTSGRPGAPCRLQLGRSSFAVLAPAPGGAVRCFAIGSAATEALRALLAERGVPVDRLSATQSLDGVIFDAWLRGRFPDWSRHLPDFLARVDALIDDLVAMWPQTVLPVLGRTPTDAARDAWGRRDLDALLDRLAAGLPVAEPDRVVARLRAHLQAP